MQRIPKIKPFKNKFNWKEINFSAKDDSERFEKNNVTIAFNVSDAKKRKLYPATFSKHNSNHEKQVILLMIVNGEKRGRSKILATQGRSEGQQWHYLAVKKLSALSRGLTSKHHGGFYCLNCLHSFATKHKRFF